MAGPIYGTMSETERSNLIANSVGLNTRTVVLDATVVDAMSTVTTTLGEGLLLAPVTATGKYKQFNPTAADGTQVVADVVILATNVDMTKTPNSTFVAAYDQGRFFEDALRGAAPALAAYLTAAARLDHQTIKIVVR